MQGYLNTVVLYSSGLYYCWKTTHSGKAITAICILHRTSIFKK